MYIDRRYHPRRRRSPWLIVALLVLVVAGGYLVATRTKFFVNPFVPKTTEYILQIDFIKSF